uniref:Uncharacterized protein n=1 Tax=Arundo donax TaxID=35708 RepID=A0A0A8YDG8_ARUDO
MQDPCLVLAGPTHAVVVQVDFTPKEAGKSDGILDIGFCKMKVTVAWSLISCEKLNV